MNKREYIDLEYLESMADGNVDVIKEMIGIFIEQVPEFINDLNERYNHKNWEQLSSVAHKTKSSIQIVGLKDLAATMNEFELLAKTGKHTEKYIGYINEFERVCAAAVNELNQYLSESVDS